MTAQISMSQLLNNFSSASSPTTPSTGQLWYDTNSSVLNVYNGSSWVSTSSGGGGGGGVNAQVFLQNGTFTVPTGVTSVVVTLFGGGGGGKVASGTPYTAYDLIAGNGGSGTVVVTGLTPGQSIVVTVGNGGDAGSPGGCCCPGIPNTDGGTTSFGTYVTATGGTRYIYGTAINPDGVLNAGSYTILRQRNPAYYGGGARGGYTSIQGGLDSVGGGGGMGGGGGSGTNNSQAGPTVGGLAYGPGSNGANGTKGYQAGPVFYPGYGGNGGGATSGSGGIRGSNNGTTGGGGGAGGVIVQW